jgi:[ribosomal protein S18]-alanine N-acetyltransferase
MSGIAVEISSGGIDELPAVERIMIAAFDPRFGEAWSKAQCLATFTMPGYALRIARHEAAIAGFAIVRWVADESELLLLAVAPALRGQGIGAALLTDWFAFTRVKGVRLHFLEMRTDNPAMALYNRFGFTVAGIRTNYYRGKDGLLRDAVTMQHVLKGN